MHLMPREGSQSRVARGGGQENARGRRWRPVGFGAVMDNGEGSVFLVVLGLSSVLACLFHASASPVPE